MLGLCNFQAEVLVQQPKVAHLKCALHLLLEQLQFAMVTASDDEVVDVDSRHQATFSLLENSDMVKRLRKRKGRIRKHARDSDSRPPPRVLIGGATNSWLLPQVA